MPCSSATVSRTSWPIRAGRPEPALRARDVEERLVEGERLDHRGHGVEGGHDASEIWE